MNRSIVLAAKKTSGRKATKQGGRKGKYKRKREERTKARDVESLQRIEAFDTGKGSAKENRLFALPISFHSSELRVKIAKIDSDARKYPASHRFSTLACRAMWRYISRMNTEVLQSEFYEGRSRKWKCKKLHVAFIREVYTQNKSIEEVLMSYDGCLLPDRPLLGNDRTANRMNAHLRRIVGVWFSQSKCRIEIVEVFKYYTGQEYGILNVSSWPRRIDDVKRTLRTQLWGKMTLRCDPENSTEASSMSIGVTVSQISCPRIRNTGAFVTMSRNASRSSMSWFGTADTIYLSDGDVWTRLSRTNLNAFLAVLSNPLHLALAETLESAAQRNG